jgi:hypothetical protein
VEEGVKEEEEEGREGGSSSAHRIEYTPPYSMRILPTPLSSMRIVLFLIVFSPPLYPNCAHVVGQRYSPAPTPVGQR